MEDRFLETSVSIVSNPNSLISLPKLAMEDRFLETSDSDTEEALSFCDLPIGEIMHCLPSKKSPDHVFEFSNDMSAQTMRSAEDIIVGGKLLPYRSPPPLRIHLKKYEDERYNARMEEEQGRINHSQPPLSRNGSKKYEFCDFKDDERIQIGAEEEGKKKNYYVRRRSESLNDLQRSQSNAKSRFLRSSCSVDYRKLERSSSGTRSSREVSPTRVRARRSNSCHRRDSVSSSTTSSSSPVKSRWHLLFFGFMRVPTEMELKDIRHRQSRRVPSSMFPTFDHGSETEAVKRDGGKGTWRLFRALSCKDHADDVITAPFASAPHVGLVAGPLFSS